MPRKSNSLQHDLFIKAMVGVNSNRTETAYKKACKRFATWAKANNYKNINSITIDVIQEYEHALASDSRGYAPSTIHSLLAPICKATSISMDQISKPKRTGISIKKGRKKEANQQGKQQEYQERYSRLVLLQKSVGIRRSELAKLKGNDLIEDETGMYIRVRRGKGGKEQFQYILPSEENTVKRIFENIANTQLVFSKDEMSNLINLHGMRAEVARKAYNYYLSEISSNPVYATVLKATLLARWDQGHTRLKADNPYQYHKQRNLFLYNMRDEPYQLRGNNKKKAIACGRPITYNRLALMAVSVNHLSHWRLDVTMTNYML